MKDLTIMDAEKLIDDVKKLGFQFQYYIENIGGTFFINHNSRHLESDDTFLNFMNNYFKHKLNEGFSLNVGFYYNEDVSLLGDHTKKELIM